MLILLVAILGALIPTAFYVLFVWWLDRYEKEPPWLLATAFLWGAIPAAAMAVLLEIVFDLPLAALGVQSLAEHLISASISAPLVEESLKGIALIGLVLLYRREFDDVLDGIVYGALIGLGFAFTENAVAYFLPILSRQGISAGLANIFMRTVVFGLNHAFWTGLVGAAVGYARLSPDWGRRLLAPLMGWAAAVVLHGIHNAGATLAEQTLCLSLLMSVIVDWGGVLLLLAIAFLTIRRESQWMERGLVDEVRHGALTPQEFDLLRSARRRFAARWRATARGGAAAYSAVGRYFQTATELAFRRQQLRSVGREEGTAAEIGRLQQQLADRRALAWPYLWSL